jgi:hypothetical protein
MGYSGMERPKCYKFDFSFFENQEAMINNYLRSHNHVIFFYDILKVPLNELPSESDMKTFHSMWEFIDPMIESGVDTVAEVMGLDEKEKESLHPTLWEPTDENLIIPHEIYVNVSDFVIGRFREEFRRENLFEFCINEELGNLIPENVVKKIELRSIHWLQVIFEFRWSCMKALQIGSLDSVCSSFIFNTSLCLEDGKCDSCGSEESCSFTCDGFPICQKCTSSLAEYLRDMLVEPIAKQIFERFAKHESLFIFMNEEVTSSESIIYRHQANLFYQKMEIRRHILENFDIVPCFLLFEEWYDVVFGYKFEKLIKSEIMECLQ